MWLRVSPSVAISAMVSPSGDSANVSMVGSFPYASSGAATTEGAHKAATTAAKIPKRIVPPRCTPNARLRRGGHGINGLVGRVRVELDHPVEVLAALVERA